VTGRVLVLAAFAGLLAPAARPSTAAEPPSPSLAATLPREDRATLAFLEHLGWRVVVDPAAAEPRVVEGRPGHRASIEEARRAGDLVLVVPAARTPQGGAALSRAIEAAADGVGSRLAWLHRVRPAAEVALARLSAAAADGRYTFPSLLGVTSPRFAFTPPKTHWVERGGMYLPRGSCAEAIAAFDTGDCLAECLVGQALGAFAIYRETLGPEAFDEAYSAEDVALGWLPGYHQTPFGKPLSQVAVGPWQGLVVPQAEIGTADFGVLLGRRGGLAFTGFTGMVRDQRDEDRAKENFVVVSATQAAADRLVEKGGFPYVKELTREAFDLWKAERKPFMTAAKLAPLRARAREIEADPVLAGIRVYIHPFGVLTLGDIAARRRKKEQAAVELYPYVSAQQDLHFKKYREVWRRRHERGLPTPR
jgi:hypothetical protein